MRPIVPAAALGAGLILLAGCSKAPQAPRPAGPGPVAVKTADPRENAAYRQCAERAAYVDSEIAACEHEELDRQDAALNAAYRALMSQMEAPKERAALISAEKTWIAYRDAQCDYAGAKYEGGTLQQVTVAQCQVDLTAERVRLLKAEIEIPHQGAPL